MRIFSVNNYSIPTPVLSAAPISYEKRGGGGDYRPVWAAQGVYSVPGFETSIFHSQVGFLYGIYN